MTKENNKYFNGIFPIMFTEKVIGKSIISNDKDNNYKDDNDNDNDNNENDKNDNNDENDNNDDRINYETKKNIYKYNSNYSPNKKIYPRNKKKKRECCILSNEKYNCFELLNDIWKAI